MTTPTLDALRALVDQQAEDAGLWFVAKTAPEAYLQQELRRLHAAIESAEDREQMLAAENAALKTVRDQLSDGLSVTNHMKAAAEQERDALADWKADEQRFLLSAAAELIDTGYKGDGVLDGIKFLKAELEAQRRANAALRELLTKWHQRIDKSRELGLMIGPHAIKECADELEAVLSAALASASAPAREQIEQALTPEVRRLAHDARESVLSGVTGIGDRNREEVAHAEWAAIISRAIVAAPRAPETPDLVCEHGTAMDVHCCNCHGGFLFDSDSCVCIFAPPAPQTCWHGHTTRQVGCVSCVLVFDRGPAPPPPSESLPKD